jgi:Flp pilus assembly protein CpaB
MEMEFKDSSRRRTLVLVVGVLLAVLAGAAAFYLSSQGGADREDVLPTREVVVAAVPIPARETIQLDQLTTRIIPADASNEAAFTDVEQVVGNVTAVTILQFQPVTPNLLAGAQAGAIPILAPTETISPFSPLWRAVSVLIPAERAVGGALGTGNRVDLLASLPINVEAPIDPGTGEPITTDPETGEPFDFISDQATKLTFLDVQILSRAADSDFYILKMDLKQAEEVAQLQTAGAQFSAILRPDGDNRDIDRSIYGTTTNRVIERYNFPIPERIDILTYPQPSAFPSPFPAEPYLSPPPLEPSPSPEPIVVVPEESPAP